MSESRKIKVYLGLPTTGTVCDTQPYALREAAEAYKDKVELVYPKTCVRRIFHDFARNAIVEDFLASDCDVLWFLDSDIAPAKHTLDLITQHWDKWMVAGAPYAVFMQPAGEEVPQILYCVYNADITGKFTPADIPTDGSGFVDGLATGCLFIKREVFTALQKPYFAFHFDEETRNPKMGEDIHFCKALNRLGIKFFTDYSMVAKHFKNVCLLEMNNYAVSYANKSVTRYDGLIRGQVEQLQDIIRKLLAERKTTAPHKSQSQLVLPTGY